MLSLKIEYKINPFEIKNRLNLTKQLYSSVKRTHSTTKPQMVRPSQKIPEYFFSVFIQQRLYFQFFDLIFKLTASKPDQSP